MRAGVSMYGAVSLRLEDLGIKSANFRPRLVAQNERVAVNLGPADIDSQTPLSAAGNEDRGGRGGAEGGLQGSGQEMAAVVGEPGAESHGSGALKADDARGTVVVHGAEAEVFGDGFEFGEAPGARDAERADSCEDGEPVAMDGHSDFAEERHRAHRDQQGRSQKEGDAKEGHGQIELTLDDLRPVDAEHGSASPYAGERDKEECSPVAGTCAGGESVGFRPVPGARGRSVEVDGAGGRSDRRKERTEGGTAGCQGLRGMERVAARAAERHVSGDVDVVCRDFGVTGGTGDLHEDCRNYATGGSEQGCAGGHVRDESSGRRTKSNCGFLRSGR